MKMLLRRDATLLAEEDGRVCFTLSAKGCSSRGLEGYLLCVVGSLFWLFVEFLFLVSVVVELLG